MPDTTAPTKTYVLYTEHYKEDRLAEYLTSTIKKKYPEAVSRIYVPKIIQMYHYRDENNDKKWEERETILFYNYVFIESNDIVTFNQVLKSIRIDTSYHIVGKNKIKGTNITYDDRPIVSVSDEEMNVINSLLGEVGIVGKSTFIKEGSHIKFLSGPLVGREADVTKIKPSKHYAILEMPFLGETRRIPMAIELIGRDADAI